jgi:hypothetical protein
MSANVKVLLRKRWLACIRATKKLKVENAKAVNAKVENAKADNAKKMKSDSVDDSNVKFFYGQLLLQRIDDLEKAAVKKLNVPNYVWRDGSLVCVGESENVKKMKSNDLKRKYKVEEFDKDLRTMRSRLVRELKKAIQAHGPVMVQFQCYVRYKKVQPKIAKKTLEDGSGESQQHD